MPRANVKPISSKEIAAFDPNFAQAIVVLRNALPHGSKGLATKLARALYDESLLTLPNFEKPRTTSRPAAPARIPPNLSDAEEMANRHGIDVHLARLMMGS